MKTVFTAVLVASSIAITAAQGQQPAAPGQQPGAQPPTAAPPSPQPAPRTQAPAPAAAAQQRQDHHQWLYPERSCARWRTCGRGSCVEVRARQRQGRLGCSGGDERSGLNSDAVSARG